MGFEIVRLDHVQLAMPPGGEDEAEAFYSGILGFDRIAKPAPMAARGGCWFARGATSVHLGVEEDFRPARKAHPALRCSDYDAMLAGLGAAGVEVREVDDIPGVRRAHIHDPFGNRIELIAA